LHIEVTRLDSWQAGKVSVPLKKATQYILLPDAKDNAHCMTYSIPSAFTQSPLSLSQRELQCRQPSAHVVFQFHHLSRQPPFHHNPLLRLAYTLRQLLAAKIYFYRLQFQFNPIHFASFFFAKNFAGKTLIFGPQVLEGKRKNYLIFCPRHKPGDIFIM